MTALMLTASRDAHPLRRALAPARPRLSLPVGWKSAGVLALLCSGVAWASLPRFPDIPGSEQREWQALGIAPLSSGGASGLAMAPGETVETVDFVPRRAVAAPVAAPVVAAPPTATGPVRIRGRVGDGLYWSLRAAGANPQVAAQYLSALATEIDVGEVGPSDGFDLVLGANRELLYAGLDRVAQSDLKLVRWGNNGRAWIDAARPEMPAPVDSGFVLPARGGITSYFGNRFHPILRFARFHAGLDIGAGWGSPIVAASDGRVVGAGWAGGYGRQVQIAHGGGMVSSYSHMSEIAAAAGSFVRRGQVIGYVGSSGLSTGPHLHFEVRHNGTPVNPLGVRFVAAAVADPNLADAVQARLKALLAIGVKRV